MFKMKHLQLVSKFLFRHSKFIMFNLNWYQYFCLFSFNWYQDAILWHFFNWYLNWLSPLFGFIFFYFRQKGGEKCIDLVLHLTLYWCLILCIKKGEKILFCFDCLPFCWWLTKRGRIICVYACLCVLCMLMHTCLCTFIAYLLFICLCMS